MIRGSLEGSADLHEHDIETMLRAITGFHRDDEGHWVAELECGHAQHVRHNPPWFVRTWVTTEQGRNKALGQTLDCKLCDPSSSEYRK